RGADRSGIHRRDVWSIPLAILREAVVNAVVHADYSQRGAPIRVSYFDDRIEIENPGILLSGLTVDDILAGVSRLRNRVIGRVFRELGLIEQWGSGMRLIMDQARQLGLPPPKIEELGLRFRLTVYLGAGGSRQHDDRGSVTGYVTGEVTGEVGRLVNVLHGEMKRVELQEALGLRHEDHFRAAYLRPAIEKGYLEMTDPERPRSSRQRYRLTAKGESLVREIAPRYPKGSAG
ncbi:MAG: AAA family ATPase, partial [Spirochaetaceae bacterium]